MTDASIAPGEIARGLEERAYSAASGSGAVVTRSWLSWDWVTDEWAQLLQADGAETVFWRAPVGNGDKEAIEGAEDYADFIAPSTLPSAASATAVRAPSGLSMTPSAHSTTGCQPSPSRPNTSRVSAPPWQPNVAMENIRVKLVPYPFEGREEDEVRQIARDKR